MNEEYDFDEEKIEVARESLPFLKELFNNRVKPISEFVLTICGEKPGCLVMFGNHPNVEIRRSAKKYNNNIIKTFKEIGKDADLHAYISKKYKTKRGWWFVIFLFNKDDKYRHKLAKRLISYFKVINSERGLSKRKQTNFRKLSGKFYGYPECCIRDAPVGIHYTPFTDKMYYFLSHSPCSSECEESAQMARRYSACINKISKNLYKGLISSYYERGKESGVRSF